VVFDIIVGRGAWWYWSRGSHQLCSVLNRYSRVIECGIGRAEMSVGMAWIGWTID
jgi:hypothetical protein